MTVPRVKCVAKKTKNRTSNGYGCWSPEFVVVGLLGHIIRGRWTRKRENRRQGGDDGRNNNEPLHTHSPGFRP